MTWKPDERLAERLALARVRDRLAIGELGDRDALAGEQQPLAREVHHDRGNARVLVADAVRDRHAAAVEAQLGGVASPTSRSSSSFLLTVKPGVPRSITSSEMPPWPAPPVRTAVVTKSARQPEVMNVFAPLTT